MTAFHLYLDSADLTELRTCLPHPVVHGVTTNPTLLKRAGVTRAALPALVEQLLKLGARQVQAQVHAADVDGMLADAQALLALADPGQIVVKIPATRQGLQAGAQLSARGVPVPYTRSTPPSRRTSPRNSARRMPHLTWGGCWTRVSTAWR